MKSALAVLVAVWTIAAAEPSPRATPEKEYLKVYLGLNDAERLEISGDFSGALSGFEDCYRQLIAFALRAKGFPARVR